MIRTRIPHVFTTSVCDVVEVEKCECVFGTETIRDFKKEICHYIFAYVAFLCLCITQQWMMIWHAYTVGVFVSL